MSFDPKFKLDLATASSRSFSELLDEFEAWRKEQPARALTLTNGWTTIDQEMAESLLLRNPVGANRRPTLPTVKYYARQMTAGTWKKTGQPVLLTTNGDLLDAGHRLWAAYLSGASFPTYLIVDVPDQPALFAYIDAGKPRSAADALATAGINGVAKLISSVVTMAMQYEHNCYTPTGKKPMDKVSPIEVVTYAQANESLRTAARLMSGEYKPASTVIGYKDVAAFVGFQILELHGEDVLENFMTALGQVPDEVTEGNVLDALRKVLHDDARSADPMKKHQVLGYVIKAFNSWLRGEEVRRLQLRVNEAFPRFAAPAPSQMAAE